jgi:hypothetical protein
MTSLGREVEAGDSTGASSSRQNFCKVSFLLHKIFLYGVLFRMCVCLSARRSRPPRPSSHPTQHPPPPLRLRASCLYPSRGLCYQVQRAVCVCVCVNMCVRARERHTRAFPVCIRTHARLSHTQPTRTERISPSCIIISRLV